MIDLYLKSEEITLVIIYESQKINALKCNNNSILEDILKNYALQMQIELSSLFFLYGGKRIENIKDSIFLLMTEEDKKRKEIEILAYNINKSLILEQSQQNYINIIFSFSTVSKDNILINIKKIRRGEILKNICQKYASENRFNFNSLIFKYEENEMDLNKKFDDIANLYDKNCLGMTIFVHKKNSLDIKFVNKNLSTYQIECNKDDKIKDICKVFASANSLDINKLSFNYGIIPIDLDEATLNDLINSNTNINDFINDTDNKAIEIIVKENTDKDNLVAFFKKYKRLIVILAIIIIILIIFLIISFSLYKKNGNENTPNSTNSSLYSFKAIYKMENPNESIKLFNSSYLKYIKEIIFENKEMKLSNYFSSNNIGNHTFYFFVNLNGLYSLEKMFSEAKNLIAINFTSFFITSQITNMLEMFINCTNLISADLSSLNLESLEEAKGMFEQCYSLKYIDIQLFNSKSLYDISNMFYGCHNLPYFDLSMLELKKLKYIDSIFKNCSSLKLVNFTNFYTEGIISMYDAFAGCYSLTSLDLSSFETKNVKYGFSMFEDCSSLTSLDISNFKLPKEDSLYFMFAGCKNLTYLNIKNLQEKHICYSIFLDMPKNGTIIVNKNLINKVKQYLPYWNIIS